MTVLSRRSRLGLADNLFSVDFGSIAKKINKPIKSVVGKINRRGPKILRDAMFKTISSHYKTSRYASHVNSFKSELRQLGSPKVGSGITLRLRPDKKGFYNRIIFSKNHPGLKEKGYYTLVNAQYGRNEIPHHRLKGGKKAFGLVVGPEVSDHYRGEKQTGRYEQYTGGLIDTGGGREFIIMPTHGPIRKVKPYHKWVTKTNKIVERKLTKLIEELNRNGR